MKQINYNILTAFIIGCICTLFGCQGKPNPEDYILKTEVHTEAFDPGENIHHLGALIVKSLRQAGLNCDSIFESPVAIIIDSLRTEENDVVFLEISKNHTGLKEFYLRSMATGNTVRFDRMEGKSKVYAFRNFQFDNFFPEEEWSLLRKHDGKTARNEFLSDIITLAIVRDSAITEIRTLVCSCPMARNVRYDAFSMNRKPTPIHIKLPALNEWYDSSFRRKSDFRVVLEKKVSVYKPQIPIESIDSVINKELDRIPFCRIGNITFIDEWEIIKYKTAPNDTLSLNIWVTPNHNHTIDKYSCGITIRTRQSKLHVASLDSPAFSKDTHIRLLNRMDGELRKSPFDFTIQMLFYINNGFITKCDITDDMTAGARKYFKTLADNNINLRQVAVRDDETYATNCNLTES